VNPFAASRQVKIWLAPSSNNELSVMADRQRLKQVILNLLNNAIKYNREGGSILINVDLTPTHEKGIIPLRISFTDNGVGISSEDIDKLFTPFERIGAEKTQTEGTGLGLAVVKKLMDVMGGYIGVDSVKGEGSTFWIELPCVESQYDVVSRSGILKGMKPEMETKPGIILYIEDNAANIELVKQILISQRSNIHLISNANGKQAVPLAVESGPDLIFLDLNLPDMNGNEVLRKLQSDHRTKSIPVVIITADAMPDQREKLLRLGAKSYLTKPIDVVAFLNIVDEYIDRISYE
ncbi:MAG: ATP-binding protein, partial [Bacteroidota bacterium]